MLEDNTGMATRILLISTNKCTTPDPVFPLGLAHLNAALRQAGHTTEWLDLQTPGASLPNTLRNFRPDLVGISLRNIDDVLIRKKETYFNALSPICEEVKTQTGVPTVVGGSGFSIFPRELLAVSGADFGVCGAGERPLLALLDALKTKSYHQIPGLVYRENGSIIANPAGPEASPTRLEPGDRPDHVVRHYLQNGGMLNIQTQRGCAFHCCYCTYPLIEGRSHRRYPPEMVAEEFKQLQQLGSRYAFIVDSVFNSSPRHVSDICEALLKNNLNVRWGCFLRPQGLSPELMRLMKRAGLQHIEFGSDSFSDEVLRAYQKGFTFEDVLKSSELAHKEGIDYCHFLISGGPSETAATLREGFKRSHQLPGSVMMAVVGMRIYPGTALHQRALLEKYLSPEADLLQPVYYLSPRITQEEVFAALAQFATESPNWIVGDPSAPYASLVQRLRQRGVTGPLWSYLSMIQRLWPGGPLPGANTKR